MYYVLSGMKTDLGLDITMVWESTICLKTEFMALARARHLDGEGHRGGDGDCCGG